MRTLLRGITLITLLLSLNTFASGSQHEKHMKKDSKKSKHDHDHDHHDHDKEHKGHGHNKAAHAHGHVKLLIAVEKNIVDILIEGSTDSFLGFEHRPKTKKEKKKYQEIYKQWMVGNTSIFKFPAKNKCVPRGPVVDWKGKKTDKHSNLALAVKYYCSPPIQNESLSVDFNNKFTNIKKLEIDVLPLIKMPYSQEKKAPKEFKLAL